jgi:hypothetical protein
MTDTEIIEVVSAHAAGKKIEYSWGHCVNWFEKPKPQHWDFSRYTYRVAPESYLISGYCFPKDIFVGDTPCDAMATIGMIKVQQVELEKCENPLPSNAREWKCFVSVDGKLVESVDVQATRDRQWLCRPIKVREVIE